MSSVKSHSGYHLVKKCFIGGEGGWDYLTVDNNARRLYVTHSTKVCVIQVDSLSLIGEVAGTEGVHGVAIASELGKGFTSNGRTGTASIFDLKTFKVLREVTVGQNPDSICYDDVSKRVFVFNSQSHNASVIDAVNEGVVATIPLGGKPEFSRADGEGRVYVNNEDTSEVISLDSRKLSILARWPLGLGKAPTGLAIDLKNRRLFSTCRNNYMIVMYADNGRILASLPIGDRSDGCAFDPETRLAFSSNGEGTLTAVREDSPTSFAVVDTVVTHVGSRTMTLDPKTHAVFLPAAEFGPTPQPTADQPRPRPPVIADTFTVLQFQI